MSDSEFPIAHVAAGKRPWYIQLSRMWLVTIACLALAVGLTWYSLDSPGQEIVIHFPEGHGLKPGDVVRHRGIDIGHVEKVQLNSTLGGIVVHAVVDASASAIAREGSRFWIVRPQLDFTGVSGLETAVGAKYVAVIPGDDTRKRSEFEGLSGRPPDSLGRDGIEIILRGDHRFGVNPGSPLTWRGVEVGQVLSSSLSPDALHVDTRVRIQDPYRRLLSRDSKFWVTSGIHMGLGVTGFKFSTESFSTIARGGIAFITPGPSATAVEVQPGDVFTLHEKPEDRWIESAIALNLLEHKPPPMATVAASWKQKYFGISRAHVARASALTVNTQKGTSVVLPADLLSPSAGAVEGSYQLAYEWDNNVTQLDPPPESESQSGIVAVPIGADMLNRASLLSAARVRLPTGPEDCFAIRKSWHSDRDSAVVIEMIGKDELSVDGDVWRSTNEKLSRDVWHGAAVVASRDEKVIGMLVVSEDQPTVVPLRIFPTSD